MGYKYFLYSAYEHKEGYACIRQRKVVRRNGIFLTLDVSRPHKHLIWYKERLDREKKVMISGLTFYKRMAELQHEWVKWLFKCPVCVPWWGLLFNLEKEGRFRRPSWMGFQRVRTNALNLCFVNHFLYTCI